MKLISLLSVLALLSTLFSRMDFPAFLKLLLLGDLPDTGITSFFVALVPSTIHTYIFNASHAKNMIAGREFPATSPRIAEFLAA
ncbi:hypothetical protein [Arthrobacter sp. Leaf141]|uniref:hypothetical protein n=1 Tax=Arthrobacter sp. Leaf141 TaxID=1736273 RepID=UPI0012F9ED51|nr:hypothetical protein [Arthrobacter sp. Leaf141]